MTTRVELEVPARVEVATQAIEIARVWVADGAMHVSLATGIWQDPRAWGIALVDLARHVASAYQLTGGASKQEALQLIRQGFDAEWGTPTDTPTGGLAD